jgi:syntaxin-binding protein 5
MARSAKGVLYRTPDLAQDFLLMPRDSPHFAGSWNPTAISMLFEDEGKVRTIEARQFLPLELLASVSKASRSAGQAEETEGDNRDALTQDLAATLQSMTVNKEPKKLNLPPSLWSSSDAIVDASLFSLYHIAYETLSRSSELRLGDLRLEGGISVPDENIAGTIKYAKVGAAAQVISLVAFSDKTNYSCSLSPIGWSLRRTPTSLYVFWTFLCNFLSL